MYGPFGRCFRLGALGGLTSLVVRGLASTAWCGPSKHDAVEKAKQEGARRMQYAAAMAWCQETGSTAYGAWVRTEDDNQTRLWPLINAKGLKLRMDGLVNNDQPYAASAVLTPTEEADIVLACKELNRHGQGVSRKVLPRNLAVLCCSLLCCSQLCPGRLRLGYAVTAGNGTFMKYKLHHADRP